MIPTLLFAASLGPAGDAEGRWRAGDTAGAVAALRAALDERPADAALQDAIELARQRVDYPPGILPPRLDGVRHRVSPAGLLGISLYSAAALLAGCVAGLRGRRLACRVLTALATAGWALCATLSLLAVSEAAASRSQSPVVVSKSVTLRAGDGHAFPPRIDWPLPPGVEGVRLHRRGGWVQVGLSGPASARTVGWLPEASVIEVASPLTMPP